MAAGCARCLLAMLRSVAEYINSWALVYSALTGSGLVSSGRAVVGLFKQRGWTAVINDDLTGSAMRIASMMVGCISALLGGGVAFALTGNRNVAGLVAFFCFLCGLAMASVVNGVLTSAVRTVFVCFAMSPAACAATHPTHLTALVNAWHVAYPNELSGCGYTAAYLTHA